MSLELRRRVTAASLVFFVVGFAAIGPLGADTGAIFSGKVVGSDPATPRADVVVTLVQAASETTYSSKPTGSDGIFLVEGAPAGSYRVVAEAPEGAYLAGDAVELAAGENPAVALTLNGANPDDQTDPTAGGQPQQKKGLPTWAKWTIVGGIVILAAVGIHEVTKDDYEPPASLE